MPPIRVLIIDDLALERKLLEVRLRNAELETLQAAGPVAGIELAATEQPDVILLDIVMEEMDGLAACAQLKANPATADIPIVFISSLNTREKLLEGLTLGAADYVTKPVDGELLLARIRTHARMHRQHLQNMRLSKELEQVRRKNELMHLTEGIAHNLNNLLGVIYGYLSLLQAAPDNTEKVLKCARNMETAIQRTTHVVRQLTTMGQFNAINFQETRLTNVLSGAIARFQKSNPKAVPVRIDCTLPAEFVFPSNRTILEPAIQQLLLNAHESYGNNLTNKEIVLRARVDVHAPEHLTLDIIDSGCGIPEDMRESVFDPFVSTSAEVGRGMGLTLARHAIRCLHGDLVLHPQPNGGTEAHLTLPLELPLHIES
jgi:signal transduction histidine kinase